MCSSPLLTLKKRLNKVWDPFIKDLSRLSIVMNALQDLKNNEKVERITKKRDIKLTEKIKLGEKNHVK